MKILFAYQETDLTDNLFVVSLIKSLRDKKLQIDSSVDLFWNSNIKYDIIHIQWPEELFKWGSVSKEDILKLSTRINHLKNSGIKLVYTRHNSQPHYKDKNLIEIYKIIENSVDSIIHLGYFSKNESLKSTQYSKRIYHTIIPHHIYLGYYDTNIDQSEARTKLGIPNNSLVILAFGKFRNFREKVMVLLSYIFFKQSNKFLLAPRLFTYSNARFGKSLINKLINIFVKIFEKKFHAKVMINSEIVSQDLLPYYLTASDLVFIQRYKILNSGNIPLALLFRKVVIGPNIGNVGELLINSGNPTFDPKSISSINRALLNGVSLFKQNKGEKNFTYAIDNLSINYITDLHIFLYNKIITGKTLESCQ